MHGYNYIKSEYDNIWMLCRLMDNILLFMENDVVCEVIIYGNIIKWKLFFVKILMNVKLLLIETTLDVKLLGVKLVDVKLLLIKTLLGELLHWMLLPMETLLDVKLLFVEALVDIKLLFMQICLDMKLLFMKTSFDLKNNIRQNYY